MFYMHKMNSASLNSMSCRRTCYRRTCRRLEVTLEPTVGNHGQKFLDKWYSKQKQF